MRHNINERFRIRSSKRTYEKKLYCLFNRLLINTAETVCLHCEDGRKALCNSYEISINHTKVKHGFHHQESVSLFSEANLFDAWNDISLSLCDCREIKYPAVKSLWYENRKNQTRFLFFHCLNFNICHTSISAEKRRHHVNNPVAHLKKQQKQTGLDLYESVIVSYTCSSTTKKTTKSKTQQLLLLLLLASNSNMIKPQAPFSLADENDSLIFCSYPQDVKSLRSQMEFAANNASFHSDHSNSSIPDLCQGAGLSCAREKEPSKRSTSPGLPKSFLLVDDQEILQVADAFDFIDKLGCSKNDTFKVVSIFGNTGDGKSYTLNHTFFEEHEVFKTSPSQSSCTLGVWCSLNLQYKAVVIDTEGLLGSSSNENQRCRLLLKVLAISDIVIYRTRAERLHTDMFVFLSNASQAYLKHFKHELQFASQKYGISESDLGPTLIVFHETTHTEVLGDKKDISADGILRQMFKSKDNPVEAFPKICYVGIKTVTPPTDFGVLQRCIVTQIKDTSVRASRRPEIIFQSLKALNDKFSQKIETAQLNTFPDQYFTCTSRCLACKTRCTLSMNHETETESHDAGEDKLCEYHSGYGNKVFMCKTCLRNRRQVVVVPKTSSSSDNSWMGLTKYIWSGYVYECSNCGIIYRSREHWYGNEDEEKVLHVEFRHVWPQGPSSLDGTHNAARKILDSFHYVADTISSVGARPTKYLSEWTADKINPSYWVPNSEIIKCSNCHQRFDCTEQKHHCRACGKGFCAICSSKKRTVPERGWGPELVRVCDACYEKPDTEMSSEVPAEQAALTARKMGEAVTTTFSAVACALDYPIGMLKNSANPAYWVPDDQIAECIVCKRAFGPRLTIHHCRACGQGVCEECSPNRCTVPLRGWDYPVRVCIKCEKKTEKI